MADAFLMEDIKELFREVGTVKEDLAAVKAISEVQLAELKEIRQTMEEFKNACIDRHQRINDDFTFLKTRQAHSNGVAKGQGDLNGVAYVKLGAIFTAVYAVLFALQWISGSLK